VAVALLGVSASRSAHACARGTNDKYPEERSKQKSDADAIKALYANSRGTTRSSRRAEIAKRRRGADLGDDDARRRHSISFFAAKIQTR